MAEIQPVDAYLSEVFNTGQLVRPETKASFHLTGPQPAPCVFTEQTLNQAIVNLLNNAADSSPLQVEIEGAWNDKELTLDIRDKGSGIRAEFAEKAGQPFYTSKSAGQGMGIGVFLANATIERLGGSVHLLNRKEGRACTCITYR